MTPKLRQFKLNTAGNDLICDEVVKIGIQEQILSDNDAVKIYSKKKSNDKCELRVRDEDGNVTVLSPHNFSIISGEQVKIWHFHIIRKQKIIL
jgi:hypothetical protein